MSDDEQSISRIAVPCGRLSCKEPVVQEFGRGRRKEYCSETCRRAADRDYKRAKGDVQFYAEYLQRSQHEVASYGRKPESGALTPEQLGKLEADARVAFARAEALAEIGVPGDHAAAELVTLVHALKPLLSGRVGFTPQVA